MATHRINLGTKGIVEVDDADITDIDLDKEVVHFDGQRLTEARAEQLAKEIQDRFESERREQARQYGAQGGRPPLGKDGGGSVQIGFRTDPETKKKLADKAQHLNRSESAILREALNDWLERSA